MTPSFSQRYYWISLLRIGATFLIFLFHYLGQTGCNNTHIDTLGIAVFCFISGYLVSNPKKSSIKWLWGRYLKIIVPFWIIYGVIIVINYFISYKDKSWIELFITFISGGLFFDDPLYVISWFITFILFLYAMVFFSTFSSFISINIFVFCLFSVAYIAIVKQPLIYLFAFFIGFILDKFLLKPAVQISQTTPHKVLSYVQDRCYSFFLIHGGIILFFNKFIGLKNESLFFASLVVSMILACIHYETSYRILNYLKTRSVF